MAVSNTLLHAIVIHETKRRGIPSACICQLVFALVWEVESLFSRTESAVYHVLVSLFAPIMLGHLPTHLETLSSESLSIEQAFASLQNSYFTSIFNCARKLLGRRCWLQEFSPTQSLIRIIWLYSIFLKLGLFFANFSRFWNLRILSAFRYVFCKFDRRFCLKRKSDQQPNHSDPHELSSHLILFWIFRLNSATQSSIHYHQNTSETTYQFEFRRWVIF